MLAHPSNLVLTHTMSGSELDTYVQNKVREYRRLAREFDLIK
ncbi:hypothetical protein [Cupriavidus metallidurans]|nr:hypothetical protein [Cupriavidus metallidurans]